MSVLSGIVARSRSLWRGVRGRDVLEQEMDEEFRAHIELRADDLARSGLSQAEARRQARLEFGSTERFKERAAASRGLSRFDDVRVSWLDFKLGFRMLAKYPGLTVVGGIAIAFAVAAGAGAFEFVNQVLHPTLPLENGDRVVAIRVWDAATSRVESRTLHDLAHWRRELKSLRDLGAFRTIERNLLVGGSSEVAIVAEISASAFRVAQVRPLLGRALVDADESADAPPVVVIGFDLWHTRFGADSGVIGQSVRLGKSPATVVGVMPEGFKFPVYHGVWVPFQLNALDYPRDAGPGITKIFGRLAPGATITEAQAEIGAVGLSRDVESPARAQLRPQVLPYAKSFFLLSGGQSAALMSVNIFLVMLMALVCSNVALLMFARAATREGEIVVRTALGASRGRIITQLFAEALVLGGVGAAAGLGAATLALKWGLTIMASEQDGLMPFWYSTRLAPVTLLYAILLTLLGAAISGVLPALKVTRGLESRLRQAAAGGGGLRFGGVWTAVIVAQVAVTLAFPVTAFFMRRDAVQMESLQVGFADAEFLSAHLDMDREAAGAALPDTTRASLEARGRSTAAELARRLEMEPGVAGVTFASVLPRMDHEQRRIDVDAGGATPVDSANGIRVSSAEVAPNYFDVVGAPIVLGRGFHVADLHPESRVVIVNQTFVRQVLGGRNPIGRHVRYAPQPGDKGTHHLFAARGPRTATSATDAQDPWFEIVGVVKDLGMTDGGDPKESGAGFYHPLVPGAALPTFIAVHLRGDPTAFTPRLGAVAAAVDPTLRVSHVVSIDRVAETDLRGIAFWFRALVLVSAIALLLSLAGIYSTMSFAVARRTREIGIRVALGSDHRRIVTAIFAHPLRQVALGIAAGALLATGLVYLVYESLSFREIGALTAYALLMLLVCLLACVVPTRRALAIQPTEALRADG